MPLDSNFGDDLFDAKCLGWERAFAWLPHRCHITKRWLWLTFAYVGTSMYRQDMEIIFYHRWHHKHAHLIWLLKK